MGLFDSSLTKTRGDKQHSELYLAILPRVTVYTARVNQAFEAHDMIAVLTYDSGVGTLADVLGGMTMLVGSAAGLSDIGVCRIRKAPTVDEFYVGEGSSIDWSDDLYLTVIIDFALFPKHLSIDAGGKTVKMDYDIEYSDQNVNFPPLPILGSHAALWLTGASVGVDFDASDSWVIDSTISGYAWGTLSASGLTVANGTTSNPTFTATVADTYCIYCDVTAANGKTSRGYRFIFVYDENNVPLAYGDSGFELYKMPEESLSKGGGEFGVRLFDQSVIDSIYDRALVVLFSRDFYQNIEGSLGLYAERENIIATGWVYGKSITGDPEQSSVEFTVFSGYKFLQEMPSYPAGVEMTVGTPSKWTEIKELTVDKGIFHFLYWKTTLTAIADIRLSGDDRYLASTESAGGSIWGQLTEMNGKTILSRPVFDKYGRLFVEIPWNLTPLADRAGMDVMDITTADRQKTFKLPKATKTTSQINLSGVVVDRTGSASSIFSLSHGHVPDTQGAPEVIDMLLLSGQSQGNSLAGLFMGARNNEFPNVPVAFTGNNRAFSLAPLQYATITHPDHTGKLIPISTKYNHNPKSGALIPTTIFEAETFEQLSTDGDIPDGDGEFIKIPPLPPTPEIPEIPEIILPIGSPPEVVAGFVAKQGFWYTENFQEILAADVVWRSWNIGLDPAVIALDGYKFIDNSRVSGRVFCHTVEIDPELWTSAGIGQGWTLVAGKEFFDDYHLDFVGNPTDTVGGTMAVNRGAGDSVLFVVAQNHGSANIGTQYFIGSSSGLSLALEITLPTDDFKMVYGGMGMYGAGKWLTIYSGDDWEKAVTRMDASATTRELFVVLDPDIIADVPLMTRGGMSGAAAITWATNSMDLHITTDNGDNFTAILSTTFRPNSATNIGESALSVGVSPSGANLAGFKFDVAEGDNLEISLDSGLTWNMPVGWLGYGQAIENCGHEDRWIYQADETIGYTNDMFTTWVDRTGDLLDKLDSNIDFEIYMFRAIR